MPKTQSRTTSDIIAKAYDDIPYASYPFAQTAPEHLHAVAHLFGLDAPAPSNARVLELGCASGGNLLPYALRNPKAKVFGVDLSGVQVKQGQAMAAELGVKNVCLKHMSIADLTPGFGKFDYVICHGVYSWVPREVQQAILRACRENLSPKGVAYVSYNTYPGWKFREVLRDAMMLRGAPRPNPAEQLSYARGMVAFLQEVSRPGGPMRVAIDEVAPMLQTADSTYITHEFLEAFNEPCYFKDFMAAAKNHRLAYLAESQVSSMFLSNLPQQIAGPLLRECGASQQMLEQYLDFVINRTFRQTLLVHESRADQVSYRLDTNRLRNLHFTGRFTPQNLTAGSNNDASPENASPPNFVTANGAGVTLPDAVHRVAARIVSELFPATISLPALVERVAVAMGVTQAECVEAVERFAEALLIQGHLRFCTHPPRLRARSGVTSPSATAESRRWLDSLQKCSPQAAAPWTVNAWHEPVHLSVVEALLLPHLDGERNVAALETALLDAHQRQLVHFQKAGQPVTDRAQLKVCVREHVGAALKHLDDVAVLD